MFFIWYAHFKCLVQILFFCNQNLSHSFLFTAHLIINCTKQQINILETFLFFFSILFQASDMQVFTTFEHTLLIFVCNKNYKFISKGRQKTCLNNKLRLLNNTLVFCIFSFKQVQPFQFGGCSTLFFLRIPFFPVCWLQLEITCLLNKIILNNCSCSHYSFHLQLIKKRGQKLHANNSDNIVLILAYTYCWDTQIHYLLFAKRM